MFPESVVDIEGEYEYIYGAASQENVYSTIAETSANRYTTTGDSDSKKTKHVELQHAKHVYVDLFSNREKEGEYVELLDSKGDSTSQLKGIKNDNGLSQAMGIIYDLGSGKSVYDVESLIPAKLVTYDFGSSPGVNKKILRDLANSNPRGEFAGDFISVAATNLKIDCTKYIQMVDDDDVSAANQVYAESSYKGFIPGTPRRLRRTGSVGDFFVVLFFPPCFFFRLCFKNSVVFLFFLV